LTFGGAAAGGGDTMNSETYTGAEIASKRQSGEVVAFAGVVCSPLLFVADEFVAPALPL